MGLDQTGRVARVVIDPVNPNVVFVAALGHCYGPQPERGVFRTVDGGRKWERVLFIDENAGAVDIVMDPANPKTLFAATWQFTIYPWYAESGGPGSGIYVSRDGGTTWTSLAGGGLPTPPLGRIGLRSRRVIRNAFTQRSRRPIRARCGARTMAEHGGSESAASERSTTGRGISRGSASCRTTPTRFTS
jgi:hypothetical protein